MIHNNKVYADADHKFVKNIIIYTNLDNTLFYDQEFSKPVLTTEVVDLFLNGAVIWDNSSAQTYVSPTMANTTSLGIYMGSTVSWFKATAPTEE